MKTKMKTKMQTKMKTKTREEALDEPKPRALHTVSLGPDSWSAG